MGFSLKNIGSRIWDQVNPLDNGRSWQTRTPTYTGSAASQIRDVFDANSAQDQRRRVQQTPIPYRVPQNYREEQIMKGNLRPYENFGEQIFGNTSKFLNTAEYGRNALEETVRGQIADWTGNDSALNSSLKRQADIRKKWANPDSGVLGAGTIFNSDKEMMDLGNAEIAKRVAGNTLGTASEIIPFAKVTRPVTIAGKGAQVLWKGGKPVTSSAILAASAAERGASGVLPRVGMNAAIDSTTGAAESVARQYAQTGKVDPTQVFADTAANTLMGQTQVAGGELWKAGKRNYTPLDISGSVPNSTNPDVPMQEATDAAKKIVDGEPKPKVSLKEQADKLAADIDAKAKKSGRRTTFAEEKKIAKAYEEAGVDPATVPAGENMYRPPTKKSPYYTDVTMKDPSRWQRFWQSTNGIISQYGDIGKATAEKIHNMRRTAEIKKAQFFNQIPNVQSLSKEEFVEFVDVLNNPKTKGSPKVQATVKEWNGMITQVLKDAREAGIDMGDLGPNYFPRIYKDINTNKGYSRLIQTIMDDAAKNGKKMTRQQAMEQATFMRKNAVKKYGNLEKSRKTDVGGYEKNHEAITEYIERAYGRISRAKEFGANDEVLQDIKAKLMEQGYDTADDSVFSKFVDIARNDVDRSTGGWKASNVARKVNAVTSLSSAAISNATQLTNTASVGGIGRTLKAMPKVALKKLGPDAWGAEARKLAAESGVALDHQIASVTENQLGAKGKITRNIASPFFASVEKFNREVSAIVGADWGDSLARKAANGDVNAEKLLREKLGVTGPIKDGVLSNSQKIEAGRKLVEISQFKVDPMDMPGWVETPLGKLAMQFRSFGYKQTGFMYNEVLREAAKGNVAPLARFVAVAVPAGYASGKAKDFVQGKMFGPDKGEDNRSDGKKAVDIVAGGINNVGGFGLPGSVATSTARGIEYDNLTNSAISTVAGPTAGKVVTLIDNIQKGEKDGNWKPLVKQGVSSVPAVGKTAANVLMPSEQTPEPKRDSNGKAVGDLTPKQIKEETKKQIEEIENREDLGYSVTKLSDGRYAFTIPGEADIRYARDLKDYKEKSQKAMFELSNEQSKVLGDKHYFRDQYGEVKVEPKFKYEYDQVDAENKLYMDMAKDAEDYGTWNQYAESQLKNLEKLRDGYNKEGQKDEVDKAQLKIENLKQQMRKYASYGGSFDKPKSSRSGGRGGSSGGSGNYESGSKYAVSISTSTPKSGKAKAAPKVAGSAKKSNISKPRVTIKKSKV